MRYGTKALPAIDWEREYATAAERRREAAENFQSGAPGAAAACGDLADRLRDAGRSGEAEPLYREALDLWRKLAQTRPAAWLPLLAESCGDLADLLAETGQTAEAVELSREALGLWWELEASDSAWRPDLAESSAALADLLADAGEVREAEELYREALGLRRKLVRSDAFWEADLADTCRSLADLLASGGLSGNGTAAPGVNAKPGASSASVPSPERAKEAEVLYCEALDRYRELSRRSPRYGADAALVCNNLGTLLCGQGRRSAGEWFYRQAIDLHRKQPDRADSAPFAASACGNLAGSMEERNPAEAERLYRSALDVWRKLVKDAEKPWDTDGPPEHSPWPPGGADGAASPPDSPAVRYLREAADACYRLASFLFTVRGDGDGAERLMREALSYLRRDTRHMEAASHIRQVLAEWGLADPIIELPAYLPAASLSAEKPASLSAASLSAEQPEPSPKPSVKRVSRKTNGLSHARPSKDVVCSYRRGDREKHRSGGWRWVDAEKPRRWARPGKR